MVTMSIDPGMLLFTLYVSDLCYYPGVLLVALYISGLRYYYYEGLIRNFSTLKLLSETVSIWPFLHLMSSSDPVTWSVYWGSIQFFGYSTKYASMLKRCWLLMKSCSFLSSTLPYYECIIVNVLALYSWFEETSICSGFWVPFSVCYGPLSATTCLFIIFEVLIMSLNDISISRTLMYPWLWNS